LIENAARRSYVCRETRLRLLDNSYRVTVILENVRHRLPSGTVGEGAVDQNADQFAASISSIQHCSHARLPAVNSEVPAILAATGRDQPSEWIPSAACRIAVLVLPASRPSALRRVQRSSAPARRFRFQAGC